MKEAQHLDFSLLTEIKTASIFSLLAKDLDSELQALLFMSEFYYRAQSALMFFSELDAEKDSWRNEARIRAGLNEFYSLEDAVRRSFRNSKQSRSPPAISDSLHPLIHFMNSLRHINVHVKPSETELADVNFTFHNNDFTFKSVMLVDTVSNDLLANKDVKKNYCQRDIVKTLDWFFENQRVFGVGEVFRVGIEAYCREVIASIN